MITIFNSPLTTYLHRWCQMWCRMTGLFEQMHYLWKYLVLGFQFNTILVIYDGSGSLCNTTNFLKNSCLPCICSSNDKNAKVGALITLLEHINGICSIQIPSQCHKSPTWAEVYTLCLNIPGTCTLSAISDLRGRLKLEASDSRLKSKRCIVTTWS